MSTVARFVYVNPIEPGPLSMRVPSGLETRLDLTFYEQSNAPIDYDILAQLELTPRTNGGPSRIYPMPATDVLNGRARAILPAADMGDLNGYRLRLYGSIQGESILLATGIVDVTEAIGPTAGTTAPDVIDQIDLEFRRDVDVLLDVALWQDEDGEVPFDLATTAITASVFSPVITIPFVVTVVSANVVRLTMAAAEVNLLPDNCSWSLIATTAQGLTTLAQGAVSVTGTITPPLVTTVANYDYAKPATADDPVAGQIVQSGITQNTLKISLFDHDAVDQSGMLALLKPGDQIAIGATTWVVQLVNLNPGGWDDILVTPIAQDAASGIVPVTFSRP